MTASWSGTLASLKHLIENGSLIPTISTGFKAAYGNPSPAELASWEQSIPTVVSALQSPQFDNLQVILELQMPIGADRADIVLLGGSTASPRGIIIEHKQWSQATLNSTTLQVDVPGYGPHQHPSLQALNYVGKLHLFHSRATNYNLKAVSFLPNLNRQDAEQMVKNLPPELSGATSLFGKGQETELATLVAEHLLPVALPPNEHTLFEQAPYDQTKHLFEILSKHAQDIANRTASVLAEAGIGLTEEQELLVEEVMNALRSRSKVTYVVQGGPGSGKTLVAVTLLLRALQAGHSSKLALRNNRLQAILRRCFDASYPGASGMLMYFEVAMQGTGIGDARFQGSFDLVILDEAQRMRGASMNIVLKRAPVTVIFLDETQRLNPPEQGTITAFSQASRAVGKNVEVRSLSAAIRSRGGQPYHDWLEALLLDPSVPRISSQPWTRNYTFQFAQSPDDIIRTLRSLRDTGRKNRVALVASFTESPGSMSSVASPDNLRVGFPLTSGWDFYQDYDLQLRWLMKPDEYVQFWMRSGSNQLDRVASIYGAQGFESDYVGVFWGRDLVIRNGHWTLGDPEACYDTIDGLVSKRGTRWWTERCVGTPQEPLSHLSYPWHQRNCRLLRRRRDPPTLAFTNMI